MVRPDPELLVGCEILDTATGERLEVEQVYQLTTDADWHMVARSESGHCRRVHYLEVMMSTWDRFRLDSRLRAR